MKDDVVSVLPSLTGHGDRFTSTSCEAMSILIVDDEDSMLTYLDRVLSGAGYRTTLAVDGPDAIRAAARTDRFDLLLTDVHMPDLTGPELVRQLRQDDPLLKVLYLTGYSDQLFTEKVTFWEEEAFLQKPCSAAGLLQAVSLALRVSILSGI
jgi:two-component system cell cycle sensor histidine kinase/response regulator CckA